MIMTHKLQWLLIGITGLLTLATCIGWVLGRRATETSGDVIANLNARINAWWAMVAVLAFATWTGTRATIILFAFVSYFALREFLTLTPTRQGDHRAMSLAFFVIIPVQYYLIGIQWYSLFTIFIPVYAFLILPCFSVMTGDVSDFLARTAKIQWGAMISVYCISHVPALLMLDIPGYENQNVLLLFYLLLVVQISDVLQYVFGKLLGKTKLAPTVSPSKTLEGLVGGALSATLVGAAMWWITPFTVPQSAGMAFVIVVMGFMGGLVLSAVKRSLGAKDWGNMIEGHGGMMDRMDSVCFSAPIFFHLTRYFFAT